MENESGNSLETDHSTSATPLEQNSVMAGVSGEDTVMAVVLPPKPQFGALSAHEMNGGKFQFRKVFVPAHRYTPLKEHWMEIYNPIFEQMKIDIRMNLKARKVELKTRRDTPDGGALQKCADFVHAYILGFDIQDAIALLRLDDLYVESFEIKDVKTLKGEHLSRAIGRLSGKGARQNLLSRIPHAHGLSSLIPEYTS